MNFKMAEKCSECQLVKDKKCKGVKLSINIVALHCRKFEKVGGK